MTSDDASWRSFIRVYSPSEGFVPEATLSHPRGVVTIEGAFDGKRPVPLLSWSKKRRGVKEHGVSNLGPSSRTRKPPEKRKQNGPENSPPPGVPL